MADNSIADDFDILSADEVPVEECDVASGSNTTPGVLFCEKFAGALDRKTVAAITEQQTDM